MKPDFTNDEKLLIAFYKSSDGSSTWRAIMPDFVRVCVALLLVGVAYYTKDILWGAVALVTLLWGIISGMLHMKRMLGLYCSIFEKYDEALSSSDEKKNLV